MSVPEIHQDDADRTQMARMRNDEEDIELIEAYMKGALEGNALLEFEQRRATDPAFDADVVEYLLIMREVRASGERGFLEGLKEWEKELVSKERNLKVVPMWRNWSIAASLALLLAAGTFWVVKYRSSMSHEELFQEYFTPYEDVISSRSDDQGELQTGMRLYVAKRYADAIPHLRNAKTNQPGDWSVPCYLGIAYLANNDPASARSEFESLVKEGSGLYREIGQWNLALTYLRLKESKLAREQLRQIADEHGHVFATQARELLDDL